jgi:2,4-dienoyl-CoA reductase-like NADH-dependent reductase (Old Yellow Enzyme family)
MSDLLLKPLETARGPSLENRIVLAPMTNMQSNVDGTLSEDEKSWLARRACGGFGMITTCSSHVQRVGQAGQGSLVSGRVRT